MKDSVEFGDVYGLDDELLAMVPQPVLAVLFLFPITPSHEALGLKQQDIIKEKGQTVSKDVFFMRQTIGNACGTIGILHALFNNQEALQLSEGPLKSILDRMKTATPEERADLLESDPEIAKCHHSSSLEGQTAAPDAETDVDLHFICFVKKDGDIYELDGRKPFPINHGASPNDFLTVQSQESS